MMEGLTPATEEQIAKARAIHQQTNSIEIDDDARLSDAMPDGFWVSAWVWVDEEGEHEDEDPKTPA